MRYVPPELLKQVKEIDLLTYFKNYEPYELVKKSSNEYATKTHDSLRMSNGLWNWFSRGIGGKNAIEYIRVSENLKFIEAVHFLLDKMKIHTPIYIEKQEKKKEKYLIIPEKNSNENMVKSYLKSRGIDEEIIQKCIDKKLIYEEKYYHNVVFCGYDEMGNMRYAGCRATNNSNVKRDATGSDKMYSFKLESNKKTNRIFIFEGAIDALSYATLFKLYGQNWEDKTLISLAGVYQPAKILEQSKVPIAINYYLKKHTEIEQIYLCLDNDEAGRNASKALKTVISDKYEVIDRPCKKGKDYNDYLCDLLGIKHIKNQNLRLERIR